MSDRLSILERRIADIIDDHAEMLAVVKQAVDIEIPALKARVTSMELALNTLRETTLPEMEGALKTEMDSDHGTSQKKREELWQKIHKMVYHQEQARNDIDRIDELSSKTAREVEHIA